MTRSKKRKKGQYGIYNDRSLSECDNKYYFICIWEQNIRILQIKWVRKLMELWHFFQENNRVTTHSSCETSDPHDEEYTTQQKDLSLNFKIKVNSAATCFYRSSSIQKCRMQLWQWGQNTFFTVCT